MIPFTEEPEGILERIESLEEFRKSGYSDHASCINSVQNDLHSLQYHVNELGIEIERLSSRFDSEKTEYRILKLYIDTVCPECGSTAIRVSGSMGAVSYNGKCDKCGKRYEIFPG
jgi:predicted RNA-binding Zn-ribbon protein involved in translation (DUF1610 family)